jgi:cytochrome c peroxidase
MRRIAAGIGLSLLLAAGCGGEDAGTAPPPGPGGCPDATPVTIDIAGFPQLVSPADNPLTEEGIALGRRLFYDPILSGDSTQSCASCHVQAHAFGDTLRFSIGIDGISGNRQAPTIVNAGWLLSAFWDGRAGSLEAQALEPVPNPIEMHLLWDQAVARLEQHPDYPDRFCAAFGDQTITQTRVVQAIAQFERTFVSNDSRYDRFLRGEIALTPAEEGGRQVFFTERGDCFHCHGQILGFDRGFHNVGLDPDSLIAGTGRGAITGDPAHDGQFKTPALRNVMVSAPYMHDGRFATIEEVLTHYTHGFEDGPRVDPLIRARLTRAPLTQAEIDSLVVFLHALTDTTFLTNPELADPFTQPLPQE